jgi:hypothetical protein
LKQIAFLLICFLLSFPAFTQNASNPVQVTSNLIPPYSLYLSDYSDASQNKWNIQLLLKDFTQTNYQAKLRITIEGAGIRLRTRQGFSAGPIRLDPGIPYQVDATDLSQYLNIQNMEVSGINRSQLASTQKLPEGFYQFKIEVLDYNRNNRVSNIGTSMAWLVLNDPPLLNLPFEEKIRLQDPQQVQFQWTPRHTSSPNSAFETEYIFKLWEIWPEGRNPNEVVRTTQPLFETTIMTTSYFYGLNDAMLIPGRSYAWQVQAINLSGRDLFNNQGKSEVKSFQYGDACQPITNLGAEAMGPDRIRITWQGEWNHNRYVAQIREKGEENWFNYGTNLETQVVYDLQADTEYEIRVIPSCGAIDGAAENVLTLKTLEQEIQDFDCGAEPNRPEITNQDPIEQLQIGDRITSAGFTVILTQLNQMGDTYSGRGLIEVPLFNGARVEANLNNIMVNTDKQLIAGNIESIYNPNGPFIIGLDREEPDLSEDGTGNQEEGEEDSFDELPEPDITIGGQIADVIVDDDTGTITVIDSEGNETEIDPETADENEDGDIAIEDDEGNVWVVDDGGNVSGPHNPNPSDPGALPQDAEIDYLVEFKSHPDQLYGFDFKQHDALAGSYEQTQLNGEDYWLAWKSVKKGTTDAVMATEISEDEFPEAIRFKNMAGNLGTGPGSAANEKQVIIQTALDEEEIIAYVLQESTNEEGETIEEEVPIGKLKVKQYEPIRKNIILVPVNDAAAPNPSLLQDKLNKIYAPAVAAWDVKSAEPFEVSEEDLKTLDEGESGMFASFPQNMRQFNRDYKRSVENFDKDAYYLFVIEGDYSDKAGIMPFKRQFGYIFKNNVGNINKTIAHELAHGAFRLRHTFSEEGFIANKNSTDNLMDYRPDGTDLYKHQWDLVHDPESVIGWLEDDEEGAAESNIFNSNEALVLRSNSKTLLKPNDIKLNYYINENKWDELINEFSDSREFTDYELVLLVQYDNKIVYDYSRSLESSGSIEWHGLVYQNDIQITSDNKSKFKLHLGIIPKSDNERSFKHWEVYLGSRPQTSGIYLESEDESITFLDMAQDIDFDVNKTWEIWEVSSEDSKDLVSNNYETFKMFYDLLPSTEVVKDLFADKENPLEYLYENSRKIRFLKSEIRVANKFADLLESISKELGEERMDEISNNNTYTLGMNIRMKIGNNGISMHSFGTTVDIYPPGNPYFKLSRKGKGEFEIDFLVERVTNIKLSAKSTISPELILKANKGFIEDFKNKNENMSFEMFGSDLYRIDEYINNEKAYDLSLLNIKNPFLDFITLQELANAGVLDGEKISEFIEGFKLMSEIFSDNSYGYAYIEQIIFSSAARQEIINIQEAISELNIIINEINEKPTTEEQIEYIINNDEINFVDDLDYGSLISEYTSFKDFTDSNYQNSFYNFAYMLNEWNDNNNFNNKLFEYGFCNVPLDLIEKFRNHKDIEWGGMDWNGSSVDYMHFEIEESKTSDYLK